MKSIQSHNMLELFFILIVYISAVGKTAERKKKE